MIAYFVSAKAYKKWEKDYDQKMLDGGGSASATGAAPTTTESTPLVGADLESHLD